MHVLHTQAALIYENWFLWHICGSDGISKATCKKENIWVVLGPYPFPTKIDMIDFADILDLHKIVSWFIELT